MLAATNAPTILVLPHCRGTGPIRQLLAILVLTAALSVSLSARADTPVGAGAEGMGGAVSLIAGGERDGAFWAGLAFDLKPGWHTYWRSAGEYGKAPRFDWSASENVKSVDVLWPVAERQDEWMKNSYIYKGETILPLKVTPIDLDHPVQLRLMLDYAVCEEICVPEETELALSLTGDEGAAALIDSWRARVPRAEKESDAISVAVEQKPSGVGVVRATMEADGETPTLLIEGPRGIAFGVPIVAQEGDLVRYTVTYADLSRDKVPDGTLRLTFVAEEGGVEAVRPFRPSCKNDLGPC